MAVLGQKLDSEYTIATFRHDPQHPKRMSFIATKEPSLAEQMLRLLERK
jgi:hypothetical protein